MSGQGGSPKNPDEDVTVTKRWKTGMIIAVVILTLVVVGLLAYIFFGHKITPVINQHLGKQINAVQTKWDSTVGQKWRDVTGVTALQKQQDYLLKQQADSAKTAQEAMVQLEAARQQQAAQSQQRIADLEAQRAALEAQTPAFLQQRRLQLQQAAEENARQLAAQQAAIRAQQAQDAASKAALARDLQEQAAQQQAALAAANPAPVDNRWFASWRAPLQPTL